MNTSIDYTPVLLAQLTDLQMRVTKQDATIAALKADVERLIENRLQWPMNNAELIENRLQWPMNKAEMRTSVPLRPSAQEFRPRNDFRPQSTFRAQNGPHDNSRPRSPLVPRDAHDVRGGAGGASGAPRSRPRVAGASSSDAAHKHPTMSLSDVLKMDESVTIQVGTGKDAEGNFTYTTAQATFDGTDLTVTACELVKSLLGMKSSKPGEILYKFIDELKNAGHITKTFTIAPWRLCSVVRNGATMTLEQLRATVS